MHDMKIYHVHLTNIRNYNWSDCITGNRSDIKFSHNDGQFTKEDLYWDGRN